MKENYFSFNTLIRHQKMSSILQASKTSFFAHCLAFLFGLTYFCLVNLIVGLAIKKVKSISRKIADEFFGCYL